ncbi:MAG: heavy metal-binding domain-containing protein [Bacteroidota bacterium]|nr:heavy metal-binding domain-containing protein [Bacteroidota bacterium]
MKNKFLFPAILVAGLMSVNFLAYQVVAQTPTTKTTTKTVKQQTVKYTCPDHPEVVQNYPGNCPKCGMKMVVKKGKGNMRQMGDSTRMKAGHMKMMHDSTMMKKGHKMMHDTTMMKKGHKMMRDTSLMKKGHKMMHDSAFMKKSLMKEME